MSGQFDFRALLIKVQDLLSDGDRVRLHFLLGDDIPRNLRDNPSLSGTLSVLESLFDKDIISEQDCDYLIEAFKKIHCYDAAKRLQEHQRAHTERHGRNCSLQHILIDDNENDRHMATDEPILQSHEYSETTPVTTQFELEQKVNPTSQLFTTIFRQPCNIREIILTSIVLILLLALVLLIIFRKKYVPSKNEFFLARVGQIKWEKEGITVAGGYGIGSELNQLNYPWGIFVDKSNSIFIADCLNHRVMKWNLKENRSEIVAGGNGQGSKIDQFVCPSDIVIDEENQLLYACDHENRRVVQWSLMNKSDIHITIPNIDCFGVIMDNSHSLYVSDRVKNEVIRLKQGEKKGTLVAGGNGKGNRFNQLNYPGFMSIDDEYALYVSDIHNHRIMKWDANAKGGIVVAGGNGDGNGLNQLSYPRGVVVDELKRVYVSDNMNHRVMQWCKDCSEGEILAGGNGAGEGSHQFIYPTGIAFDRKRNLYVADNTNHRIQKFAVDEHDTI
ncbi:unnamed protein product [Adineta ricciae]|uniref:DED domain-containing protein n=1 Tax=Adineta ricciae TaxID=249248 RepID=A0A816DNA4_ADIRI|nr:unnamed protein product [Adineta ricciae]